MQFFTLQSLQKGRRNTTVKPLYNDMVFAAKRIVIKGVLLYSVFIYKMHLRLKLGNNIVYLRLQSHN